MQGKAKCTISWWVLENMPNCMENSWRDFRQFTVKAWALLALISSSYYKS